MHASYDGISAGPMWFDEHVVPRHCAFEPDRSASIYVGEIALAEITCQECKRRFRVAFSVVNFRAQTIAEAIRSKTLHYGDPPRHDTDGANSRACLAGASMNSEPRRVLEYWRRHGRRHVEGNQITNSEAYFKGVRDPSLEIDIQPEWVEVW
jgi:hypothetical protein